MRASFVFFSLGIILLASLFLIFFKRELSIFFGKGSDLFNKSFDYELVKKIELENSSLKKQLEEALKNKEGLSRDRTHLIADVYSSYPWNDRSLIVIDLGGDDGIEVGMPVLAEKGIILGKIKSVKRTQSEVITIFDPNWRGAVSIGKSKEKAVLVGGTSPRLELISKDSKVAQDEEVSNLSKELPINYFFGKIDKIQADPTGVWLSAKLNPPYNLPDLRQVLVLTNFP